MHLIVPRDPEPGADGERPKADATDQTSRPGTATDGAVERLVPDESQTCEGQADEERDDEARPEWDPRRQREEAESDHRQVYREPQQPRASGVEDGGR